MYVCTPLLHTPYSILHTPYSVPGERDQKAFLPPSSFSLTTNPHIQSRSAIPAINGGRADLAGLKAVWWQREMVPDFGIWSDLEARERCDIGGLLLTFC